MLPKDTSSKQRASFPPASKQLTAMMSIPLPSDVRILKVMQAGDSNPAKTIQDLSRMVNLSRSRLSHLFKAQTGTSLDSFLWNRRMERAANLLRSTEMRIKEITNCVGYQHTASFNRAFQKMFGSTPTSYRSR